MTISSRALRVFYGFTALVGLVGVWGNNVQYLPLNLGLVGSNVHYWQQTLATPASRSVAVEVMWMFATAATWMLLEGRRLRMRSPWVYVALGAIVAIAFSFPLFLLQRERVLARQRGEADIGKLEWVDLAMLGASTVVACAYTTLALTY